MLALRGAALAALNLGILVRVDENVQGLVVPQDHVGGAAYDNAVTLLGKVLHDLPLGHSHPDGLVHDLEGLHTEPVTDGQRIGRLDALFRHMGHIILVESVLLGDHLDDLMVIAGNAQRARQTLAQLAATRAKFTADSDDTVHNTTSSQLYSYVQY